MHISCIVLFHFILLLISNMIIDKVQFRFLNLKILLLLLLLLLYYSTTTTTTTTSNNNNNNPRAGSRPRPRGQRRGPSTPACGPYYLLVVVVVLVLVVVVVVVGAVVVVACGPYHLL